MSDNLINAALELGRVRVYTDPPPVFFAPPLIGVLAQAQDLYRRGWNVIPLPRSRDWQERNPKDKPGQKTPFLLEPFFLRRLHNCGDSLCRHVKTDYERFERLFFQPFTGEPLNIGVVLGRTSGNLLQIDCETVESLYRLKAELHERGLSFWGTLSARGGSFFLRCAEGEIANVGKLEHYRNEVELWGRERFAVLPPSRHPDGKTTYAWQTGSEPRGRLPEGEPLPAVSITDLEFLGAKLYQVKKSGTAGFLTPKNRALLTGDVVTDGSGRNDKFIAFCYELAALVQHGDISEKDAKDLVYEVGSTKLYPPYSNKTISEKWHYAMKKPRTKARSFVSAAPVNAIDWRSLFGRRAASCEKVYQLALDTAAAHGGVFMFSMRFVAENTGIASQETVNKTIGALVKAKLLRRHSMDKKTRAMLYGFGASPVHNCSNRFNPENIATVMNTQKQDFQGALNGFAHCAGDVYQTLLNEPTGNISSLARTVGANVATTRRALWQLRQVGAVEFSTAESIYYSIPLTAGDWQAIAQARGITQKQADKIAQFETERDVFTNRRAVKAIFRYYGEKFTAKSEKGLKQYA